MGPRGDATETHTGPRTVNAEEPRHRGPAKTLRVAIWQEEQEERRAMRCRESRNRYQYRCSCPATVAFTRGQTGSVTRAADVATRRKLVCSHCCAPPANDHQFSVPPSFPIINIVDLGFVTKLVRPAPSRSTRRRCSPTGKPTHAARAACSNLASRAAGATRPVRGLPARRASQTRRGKQTHHGRGSGE